MVSVIYSLPLHLYSLGGVFFGIRALEFETQARPRGVGAEVAALWTEDPVEEHYLKTHVVVEVFEVRKRLHRAADVRRDSGRAVGGEGDLMPLADPIDPQQIRYPGAAGHVGLKDVYTTSQVVELVQGPLVLARGDGEAC